MLGGNERFQRRAATVPAGDNGEFCPSAEARWQAAYTMLPSTTPIGVAARAIEGEPVMLGKRADGIAVLGIGIAVAGADNDRPERPLVLPGRR